MSEITPIFYKPTKQEILDGGFFYAGIFAAIGGAALLGSVLQQRGLYAAGQHMAYRVRIVLFG